MCDEKGVPPQATPQSPRDFKYWAFISYSSRDRAWGEWLHRSLESYRVPRPLVGKATPRGEPVPARAYPVFRDRDELPTDSDLGTMLHDALGQSRYLVVVCSPNSARSLWVNKEVLYFRQLGRENRILSVIVGGSPNATDRGGDAAAEECYPPALRFATDADGRPTGERLHPISADARPTGDGRANALLKVLAGVLGVNYDDLKQRDARRQRLRRRIMAAAAVCAAAGIVAVASSVHRARQAERQRLLEEEANLEERGRAEVLGGDYLGASRDLLGAYRIAPDSLPVRLMLGTAARGLEGLDRAVNEDADIGKVFTGPKGDSFALFAGGTVDIWATGQDKAAARVGTRAAGAPFMNNPLLVYSPDGRRAAFAAAGRAYLYDPATGRQTPLACPEGQLVDGIRFVGNPAQVRGFVLDVLKGQRLVTWDALTGSEVSSQALAGLYMPPSLDASGTLVFGGYAELAGNPPKVVPGAAHFALFDPQHGKMIYSVERQTSDLGASLNPTDTRMLVSGNAPRVYSGTDGALLSAVPAAGAFPIAEWSPSGRDVIVKDLSGVEIRDGMSAALKASFPVPLASALAVDPGERYLATAVGTEISVFDYRTGALLNRFSDHLAGKTSASPGYILNTLRFTSSGDRLVYGTNRSAGVWLWRKAVGDSVVLAGHNSVVESVEFNGDGSRVVTASLDNSAIVWDARTGGRLATLGDGHVKLAFGRFTSGLTDALFVGDGSHVVTCGFGDQATSVRAWSLGPKAEAADLPVDRHTQFVFNEGYRMAESADGRRLFAGSFLGWGEVWELPSLRPLFNPRTGATPKTGAVVSAETPFGALSRDGARLIVTENGFPEARVFDATTGTVVLALEDPGSDLVRAEINPAGGGYLTLDAKGRISLWDAAGRVLGRANESGPKINEVHFSQDGAFVAAACEDGKARIWRIPSMELAWTGAGAGDGTRLPEMSPVTFGNRYPRRGMTCVGISPDGTLVAAGNDAGAVMVWDASNGRQLELFGGHTGPVNAVSFDKVGRRVASASDDWTARIWDLSLEGRPADAIASLLSKVGAEAPQAQPTGPGK